MGSSVILPTPGQPKEGPDPGFISGSVPNRVSFRLTDVDPPSFVYLQRDDIIGLNMQTSIANEAVNFNLRLLLTDQPQAGQPTESGVTFSPPVLVPGGYVQTAQVNLRQTGGLRSNVGTNLILGECYLLAVSAQATQAGFPGQTLVWSTVFRGPGASPVVFTTLFRDYVTVGRTSGWPNGSIKMSTDGTGNLRVITGTVPAAGAEITENVPTGARWQVLSVRASLTTSATVANRTPEFAFGDLTGDVGRYSSGASQAAGTTTGYTFGNASLAPAVAGADVDVPIPGTILLNQTQSFRTRTVNLQAGDQWTAPQYLVQEWLDAI